MNGGTEVPHSTPQQKERKKRVCQICGAAVGLKPGVLVKPTVGELIRKELGGWDEEDWICESDLRKYRYRYIEALVETEKGELTDLEREVLDSIKEQDILATNPIEDADLGLKLGQRMADRIADLEVAGSSNPSFVWS